jgi:hypothetical protein
MVGLYREKGWILRVLRARGFLEEGRRRKGGEGES